MDAEIQIVRLYDKIALLLHDARTSLARAVNHAMALTYYEIGRMIVEEEQHGQERAAYGKHTLKELSNKLSSEFGKGFSVENLDRMRFFYLAYSPSISSTMLTKFEQNDAEHAIPLSAHADVPVFTLSWSHYLKLMRIDDLAERRFYEIDCAQNNWSVCELQRQYDTALYQRLALSRDKEGIKQLARQGQLLEKPIDAIKDPYVLEFLGLPEQERYSESELEQHLIEKLEHFLLELGKGFTFVGRQVRITFDEKHFRVDLVFYNRLLRCFVAIDLKIGELTHQDIGQMQMYVHYYDRFIKLPEENKTVGIILCRDKNETLVEITLPEDNDQIFASRYQTVLPNKEELRQLLAEKI